MYYINGSNQSAHRLAYEWMIGEIPEGKELDHICLNRNCVNPEHLEAVDHLTNLERGTNYDMPKTGQTKSKKSFLLYIHNPKFKEERKKSRLVNELLDAYYEKMIEAPNDKICEAEYISEDQLLDGLYTTAESACDKCGFRADAHEHVDSYDPPEDAYIGKPITTREIIDGADEVKAEFNKPIKTPTDDWNMPKQSSLTNGEAYRVGVKASKTPSPEATKAVKNLLKAKNWQPKAFQLCKHGADPKLCKHAKNGKPCK